MKKLLVGPLLMALGLLVMACGDTPTLLPTATPTVTPATPTVTPATAAATAISSTPPASPAPAVGPSSNPTAAAGPLLLSAGTYAVGTALPAGTYKGQSLSQNTRYQIATDPNGKDVVTKSPQLTGQFSLKLRKGQYLVVTGVMKITKVK